MTSSPWSQVPNYSSRNSEEYYPNQRHRFRYGHHRQQSHHHHLQPNMPGIPMNFPLPPATLPPPPPQLGPTGNILSSPLPTALFPLPLDPLCPPAVLPIFPNGTTQSSGYSTAGHSRSSSPMNNGTSGNQNYGNSPTTEPTTTTTASTVSQVSSSRNPSPSSVSPGGGSSGSNGGAHHLPPPFPSPNIVFEAPSTEITMLSHFPTVPGQFVVYFHINPGVHVSFSVGDQIQVIKGQKTDSFFLTLR